MKKLLLLGLLLASGITYAEDTQMPEGMERRVVELRITAREEAAAAPNKSRRKRIETKELAGYVCSGSFINPYGHILTAGHCVRDAAEIQVITYDKQIYEATIVATSSVHDLALIHIDKLSKDYFPLASEVSRGEKIFIVGSPLGITDTLSTGVIAKLSGDRTLIDCSALPGNSGSAVFDKEGKLVGVLVGGFVVGFGSPTHLNIMQSVESVLFFLLGIFK